MTKTRQKPAKPRKDYPLFPHGNGQWAKKIRGKQYYFGPWDDPDAAETKYLTDREYLQAGRKPPQVSDGCRVRDLCNRFLTFKESLMQSGELATRSFRDYHKACERVIEHFGRERLVDDIRVEDFEAYRLELSKGRGLHAIGTQVTCCRMIFNFAFENELIEKPVRFGQNFKRPSKKSMRVDRGKKQREHGRKMIEAVELRQLIGSATRPLKAMILLGANGALGAADIAVLPQKAIDGDWMTFARVKTGIDRRIPLWPETIAAIKDAIRHRPKPKDELDSDLIFITKYGQRWVRTGPSGTSNIDKICDAFNKVLRALDLKRTGVGFYAIRHTFETIGGGAGDQVAVDAIMGHINDDMASSYREFVPNDRLLLVTNHIRNWLWTRQCDSCSESQISIDANWRCDACGIQHSAS
jgi:integrase